ncbi:MAG: hypothetical protein LC101_06775 [Flavobacteriales bacterium]|nr:hypothetical protein [Flavobacteriales bacterium]
MKIQSQIIKLLSIVKELKTEYPNKEFTLDGRLLGDIGEVLAATVYDIELNVGLTKHHDAVSTSGQKVQIKATMKDSLTYPARHTPDFYLGIKILPNGDIQEIFNGPGKLIGLHLKNRKMPNTGLHNISIKSLQTLNDKVKSTERVPKRRAAT